MATSFLIQSGSAALPLEYSFICPAVGAVWNMDRFIPSSRQPQHWSRNYHGSFDRRRSMGHRKNSPEAKEKDASYYQRGVTLRAEDLLAESESKLGAGSRLLPANHLSPRPGDDRRAALGGSATELAQCNRPRAPPLRRSSEGAPADPPRRRKSSSSSSNAADDPTSSSCSSASSTSSSSSSSESGCNADSETCNYCRLSESSEGCETSAEENRSSPPRVNGDCRLLTRALSEECRPPSKHTRRLPPGDYLRQKRIQMERLRQERDLPSLGQLHSPFQRSDSDPRLSRTYKEVSPTRSLNYASPTRNRITRPNRTKEIAASNYRTKEPRRELVAAGNYRTREFQSQEAGDGNSGTREVPTDEAAVSDYRAVEMQRQALVASNYRNKGFQHQGVNGGNYRSREYLRDEVDASDYKARELEHEVASNNFRAKKSPRDEVYASNSRTNESPSEEAFASYHRTREHPPAAEVVNKVILPVPSVEPRPQGAKVDKPRRSALAKNIAERQSRARERRPSVVWSQDDAAPFAEHRAFRCAVCDCDIPFTNCVLCNAEAKATFLSEACTAEIQLNEGDLVSLESEDLVIDGEKVTIVAEVREGPVPQMEAGQEELKEFYDHPTPAEHPSLPEVQRHALDTKRGQWLAKSSAHKSLNHEVFQEGRRSRLRKYSSEPVPQAEDFHFSREHSEAGTSRSGSIDSTEANKAESSASGSSSAKSEKSGEHRKAKDSSNVEASLKESCHFCGKTAEEEEAEKSQEKSPRKSPSFLKPEFNIEPEIIHKANPLVDEADVDILPSAAGAFRRLSEDEFISILNIHEASKKGDLHVVKLLTKKDPKQMETVDERGWTPIHLAAAHGHTEVVQYLAVEGAHLAALDPSSYTAIHLAAMNGHNPVLEVLLPMGVDVDAATAEGFTALHLAVMNSHLDCIQTLLQWGASTDKRDALGRGLYDMIEEYNLRDVANLLKRFHKQLHNFKHLLDMMKKEGKNAADMPPEFMDILASIAEESGTE